MKQFSNVAIVFAAITLITFSAGAARAADQIDASFDRAFAIEAQNYDAFESVVASWDRALVEPQQDNFFYVRTAFSRLVGAPVSHEAISGRSKQVLAFAGWEEIVSYREMLAQSLVASGTKGLATPGS